MLVIGVTGNLMNPENRLIYPNKKLHIVEASLIEMIEKTGNVVLVLPVHHNLKAVEKLVSRIDGLILSGGTDISCELYDEELMNERWKGQIERDNFEIAVLSEAKKQSKPILGICRGHQLINVAYQGSLFQDILSQNENCHKHRDQEEYDRLGHNIKLSQDSPLHKLLEKEEVYVNSIHHQAIKKLGNGLEIMAHSDDGLIEAIYDPNYKPFLWGVQWHPEWMSEPEKNKVIQKFLSFADSTKKAD